MTTKPALTEEEWGKLGCGTKGARPQRVEFDDEGYLVVHDGWETALPSSDVWHALAALCLHGQPYGFTWEDVDILRREAGFADDEHRNGFHPETEARLLSLADRIAALLPPRT